MRFFVQSAAARMIASYALNSGDFYSVSEGVPEAENMELHVVNAKRKGDNSGRF